MDRQPHLSAVVVAVEVVAVEAVAEVAVAETEEKQMVVAWMREVSLPMEVSYLNRSKR